jgi:hypothetical protein
VPGGHRRVVDLGNRNSIATVNVGVSVIESNDPPDTGDDSPIPSPADSRLRAEHHCFLSRPTQFEPPLSAGAVHTWGRGESSDRPLERHPASVRSTRPRRRTEAPQRPIVQVVPADARASAERAMRLLIEVIDRRRSAEQLSSLFTAPVIDLIRTIVRTPPPGRRLGFAAVRRVHVAYRSDTSAEIFGSYTRGPRTFAFAGRIEQAVDPRRPGWTVTSLRVG